VRKSLVRKLERVPPTRDSLSDIVDASVLDISAKILHIIDRYRLRKSNETGAKEEEGRLKFLTLIYSHVKAGQPVRMCLPAFPFKSPNSTLKVMGALPDKAEEFALARLNGLCQAIEDTYAPGAKLTIISDGLVYNGRLKIS
jgi:pyoverdine/dityrosine biosynthesis protein Dit1